MAAFMPATGRLTKNFAEPYLVKNITFTEALTSGVLPFFLPLAMTP